MNKMMHSSDDMTRLFSAQRAASRRDPFPDYALRKSRIDRLIALLLENRAPICDAVAQDFGKRSADNTLAFDVLPPLNSLKYARKNLRQWMRPERRRSNFPYNLLGGKSEIHYGPLGVVGNISPWNFPVTLALCPMGGILAAGNRVMLKPSEYTPATSTLLQEKIASYFDPSEIAVVTGEADLSAAFSRLPFDHLLFTGSTSVARHVARSAADNLVPTTLELGGKSPVVVGDSADLHDVAKKLLFAKTLNAGQICLAPDYVLIHPARRDALIEALQVVAKSYFPRGYASPDYVNIISQRQVARLSLLLLKAEQAGNTVIPLFEGDATDERTVQPSLIKIDNADTDIMREEIFGPLLPILAADDFDAVVAEINSRPRPLALYYMGSDRHEIRQLTQRVACGGMVINDLLMHFLQDDLPFGGIGDSGMGSYHGREGFLRFSHAKSVYTQSRFDVGALLRPPYTERFRKLVQFQLKG